MWLVAELTSICVQLTVTSVVSLTDEVLGLSYEYLWHWEVGDYYAWDFRVFGSFESEVDVSVLVCLSVNECAGDRRRYSGHQ